MNDQINNVQIADLSPSLIQEAVMALLKWNEQEYCEFQYDQGLAYVDAYIRCPRIGCDFAASRIFWNWWKNHWKLRNVTFLKIPSHKLSLQDLRQLYVMMHDGRALVTDIHPNKVVLEESYSSMVHEIIKEAVR